MLKAPPLYPMRVLRIREICIRLSISRSSLYVLMSSTSPKRDPDFPKRIRLGSRAVGILEIELNAYLAKKAGRAGSSAEEASHE